MLADAAPLCDEDGERDLVDATMAAAATQARAAPPTLSTPSLVVAAWA